MAKEKIENSRLAEVMNKIEEIEENKAKKKATKTKSTKTTDSKKTQKELTVKKNPKDITIKEEQLEKIEEEIKKQKTIPEERKKKINKRVFQNIIIAVFIVLYFIFLNLGFAHIEAKSYIIVLQVLSMLTIAGTIIIFEIAYKKDSGELTIYGIEALALSITTLMTIYTLINFKDKYTYINNAISMLFGTYYVGKSIVVYVKMRKRALKRANDIHKIAKNK